MKSVLIWAAVAMFGMAAIYCAGAFAEFNVDASFWTPATRSTIAAAGVVWLMVLVVLYWVTLLADSDDD
jgi:hypothetical protein